MSGSVLTIFTKGGVRYVFDERVAIVEHTDGRVEYCYAHWLTRFVC